MARKRSIYQDNKFTKAWYSFSLRQKKFIYFMIEEVQRLERENKLDEVKVGDDYEVRVKISNFKPKTYKVSVLDKELENIPSKRITIRNNEGVSFSTESLIPKIRRNKGEHYYRVFLSKIMLDFFINLKDRFTKYSLNTAKLLPTVYSQRFFELISMYKFKDDFTLYIDDIKKMFELKDEYDYGYIKRRIIVPSENVLESLLNKGLSDITFWHEPIKKGKKVVAVKINIERPSEENYIDEINSLCSNLSDEKESMEYLYCVLRANPSVHDEILKHLIKLDEMFGGNIPKEALKTLLNQKLQINLDNAKLKLREIKRNVA